MLRSAIKDIDERIKDPEYAKRYGAEIAKADFAVTFARVRKQAHLTQKEMAEKLGVSQPYIAKIEGGEANPTLSTIGMLLAIMGLKLVTQTVPLAPIDTTKDGNITNSYAFEPADNPGRHAKEPIIAEPSREYNNP